ncbi:MAG: Yip1 family protein [Burkholderiales bacterium]
MNHGLQRAARVTVFPDAEWRVISGETPHPRATFTRFVLPLALIPAASWALDLLLFGGYASGGNVSLGASQIFRGGLMAYAGMVLSICLCAASIVIVAPLFTGLRNWSRALQVAAYSSAPVLLGGILLILPNLAFALIVPYFHGLYLQYAGLQHVLAVKERDAAQYVALSTLLLMVLSTIVGALGMWAGLL